MPAYTQVCTPVDFDADGKQCDWLRVPYSTNLSGYGFLPIPLVCIRNGAGPTALLIGGSHGDEYEGQAVLGRLARELVASDVRGRILILPSLNMPAVEAGARVSPLDGGNLNRSFPGDPVGGPTAMLAHYVGAVLLPLADFVIDLHAGGRSSHYLPCALLRVGRTAEEELALAELAKAFAAPVTSISDGAGGGGATTLSATAQEIGVPVLTAELGGGASLAPDGMAIAEQGVRRVLHRYGIVPNLSVEPAPATRFMYVRGRGAYGYAMRRGLFEAAANLGDTVAAGQRAGLLHCFDRPWDPPEEVLFSQDGLVACQRSNALTHPGDCLYKLLVDAGGA
jgi:predicted deacylase